ncbi:hypothetical protein RBB50_000255 [Rhinocladiella similis]
MVFSTSKADAVQVILLFFDSSEGYAMPVTGSRTSNSCLFGSEGGKSAWFIGTQHDMTDVSQMSSGQKAWVRSARRTSLAVRFCGSVKSQYILTPTAARAKRNKNEVHVALAIPDRDFETLPNRRSQITIPFVQVGLL